MKPTERDAALLNEVAELIKLTIDHTAKDMTVFLANDDMRDAAAMRVQTIGEYMRSLSEEFREAHTELPWRQSIAMRNIIAHEYGKIDYVILWKAIAGNDFAQFLEQVQEIINLSRK